MRTAFVSLVLVIALLALGCFTTDRGWYEWEQVLVDGHQIRVASGEQPVEIHLPERTIQIETYYKAANAFLAISKPHADDGGSELMLHSIEINGRTPGKWLLFHYFSPASSERNVLQLPLEISSGVLIFAPVVGSSPDEGLVVRMTLSYSQGDHGVEIRGRKQWTYRYLPTHDYRERFRQAQRGKASLN